MARNFKVRGETYRLDFSLGRVTANVHRVLGPGEPARYLGAVSSHVRNDGVEVWKALGRIFKPTAMAAARALIQAHDYRESDVLMAFAEAEHENRRRDDRAEQTRRRNEQQAARDAEEANRRATEPMLTVIRHEADSYSAKAGWARKVVIYGSYDGVDIYYESDLLGTMKQAKVGWASHGAVSVQSAREYALAILRAADEAEAVNRKVEVAS